MTDDAEREPYKRPMLPPEKFYAGIDAARDALAAAKERKAAKPPSPPSTAPKV